MALPQSCSACAFYPAEHCQRHAPSPGEVAFEVVYWPKVAPGERCGSGAVIEPGTTSPLLACGSCLHWWQPDGAGLVPFQLGRHDQDWWDFTGYCTRFAPHPSTNRYAKVRWKVTHADEGCGDGEALLPPA